LPKTTFFHKTQIVTAKIFGLSRRKNIDPLERFFKFSGSLGSLELFGIQCKKIDRNFAFFIIVICILPVVDAFVVATVVVDAVDAVLTFGGLVGGPFSCALTRARMAATMLGFDRRCLPILS
jgi:hypothetical protein